VFQEILKINSEESDGVRIIRLSNLMIIELKPCKLAVMTKDSVRHTLANASRIA
jgi:hypothetical protein